MLLKHNNVDVYKYIYYNGRDVTDWYLNKFEFKDFDSTAQYSVPYQVGNTVLEILRKHPYKTGKKLVYTRPWYFLWLFKVVRWK